MEVTNVESEEPMTRRNEDAMNQSSHEPRMKKNLDARKKGKDKWRKRQTEGSGLDEPSMRRTEEKRNQ